MPKEYADAARSGGHLARQHPDAIAATDEVLGGPLSRAIDQAENRMHAIKTLTVSTV